MRQGDIKLGDMLAGIGLTSGPVVVSDRVFKGHELARIIADSKAQESIRSMTARILVETGAEQHA